MATVEKTRAEQIDEYVLRAAFHAVIDHQALWCADTLEKAIGPAARGSQDITVELEGSQFGALWPDDEDTEKREYLLVTARACSVTAAMLTFLTTGEGQEQLRSEAIWQATLASSMVREAEALDS